MLEQVGGFFIYFFCIDYGLFGSGACQDGGLVSGNIFTIQS